jgi:hypothetical protein
MHKTGDVLNYLPKRTLPKAKKMLYDIWQAETREDAHASFDLFIETFEAKYPKAIESAFATIRHQTKRTKGCLIRDGMLHMMLKPSRRHAANADTFDGTPDSRTRWGGGRGSDHEA